MKHLLLGRLACSNGPSTCWASSSRWTYSPAGRDRRRSIQTGPLLQRIIAATAANPGTAPGSPLHEQLLTNLAADTRRE